MKFSNIVSKKTFTAKDGSVKTKWLNVGTFKETDDGKRFIEFNMLPNETYYVFDDIKNDKTAQTQTENVAPIPAADNQEINTENIPF